MAGGVELATAYVTLIPSLKGAKGTIGREIGPEATDAGESFAQRFASAASTGLKIAAAAGVAAIMAATKASLEEYANYEQLVGGIETLFGDAAAQVQANAEEAFRTAGLSANQYMETVTGFSAALINSLGGDTERAAALADQALRDMADNANKMGSDMESIQNAYTGFSRGVYTMLDNLKLGYGGTKEEMERLLADAEAISGIHYDISNYADVVEAIHVIQTEMGITGTTAEEAAGTIQGSMAATAAAWTNLLTHLGDPSADIDTLVNNFVDSLSNMLANVGQRIPIILTQLMTNLPNLTAKLGELFAQLAPAIVEVAPMLSNAFSSMILGLVEQLPTFIPQLLGAAAALFGSIVLALLQAVGTLATELGNAVQGLIDYVAAAAPDMLAAAMSFLQGIMDAIWQSVSPAVTAIGDLLNGIGDAIADFDLLQAGIDLMQGLIDGIASMAGQVWDAVCGAVQGAVDGALQFLGIASPSKLFHQIGEYTMEGFAEGIDDASAQARLAMTDATAGITASVQTGMVGAAAGGVSYYIYFNDMQVNDTPAIRREVDDFVLTMLREADQ